MSFSWNTIGMKHRPVRGQPEQFKDIESVFRTMADRTNPLSDDLWDIRRGRSEGFAGEAAETVGSRIGDLLVPLSDVPKVSSRIESVFDRHGCELEVLRTKAGEALARARTRWDRKATAETDVGRFESSVSSINSQISQLRCYCLEHCCCNVEGRRQGLESSLRRARSNLRDARDDLTTANGLVDDSRLEWKNLYRAEEVLNDSTAEELKNLPLWSLKDTGNWFSEAAENVWDWVCESWDYFLDELLEVLYEALSTFLDWLDIAGIVLEWIPLVNLVYKAVELAVTALKLVAGLAMVLTNQMTLMEFMLETAIDLAGFLVPGGRFLAKGATQVMKRVGPSIKALSSGVERGAKEVADTADRIGDIIEEAYKQAGRGVRKGAGRLADKAQHLTYRVAKFHPEAFRPAIRKVGDLTGSGIRSTGRGADRALRTLGESADDMIDTFIAAPIEYAGKAQRIVIHNTIDFLNTELKLGSYEKRDLDDILNKSLQHPADLLEDQLLEALKREREASRSGLPLSDYGEPVQPGRSSVLVPCHL